MRLQIPNFLHYPLSATRRLTFYRIGDIRYEPGRTERCVSVFTYSGRLGSGGIEHIVLRKYSSPTEYVDVGPSPPIPDEYAEYRPNIPMDESSMQDDQVPGPSRPRVKEGSTSITNAITEFMVPRQSRIDREAASSFQRLHIRRSSSPQPGCSREQEPMTQMSPQPGPRPMPGPSGENKPRNQRRPKHQKKKRPTGEIQFHHIPNANLGDTWTVANEELKRVGRTEDGSYYVEKIVDVRYRSYGFEYLVKWFGWSSEFNSWEREDSFPSPDAINTFLAESEATLRQLQDEGRRNN